MKQSKLLLLLLLFCMTSGHVFADSYLTLAENDTLRISPNRLSSSFTLSVIGNFDGGVADHFRLEMTHPNTVQLRGYYNGQESTTVAYGMQIPYLKIDGSSAVYNAILTELIDEQYIDATTVQSVVESSTTVFGYWDYNNDGTYEPYGLVKWGPGRYERMFDIDIRINSDCTGDSIVFDGLFTCTSDWRYPTSLINGMFHRSIYILVAYQPGDVNGDDMLSMSDVTMLNDYLTSGGQGMNLNQYQLDAADVNRDGNISIGDVTRLIDMLMS